MESALPQIWGAAYDDAREWRSLPDCPGNTVQIIALPGKNLRAATVSSVHGIVARPFSSFWCSSGGPPAVCRRSTAELSCDS